MPPCLQATLWSEKCLLGLNLEGQHMSWAPLGIFGNTLLFPRLALSKELLLFLTKSFGNWFFLPKKQPMWNNIFDIKFSSEVTNPNWGQGGVIFWLKPTLLWPYKQQSWEGPFELSCDQHLPPGTCQSQPALTFTVVGEPLTNDSERFWADTSVFKDQPFTRWEDASTSDVSISLNLRSMFHGHMSCIYSLDLCACNCEYAIAKALQMVPFYILFMTGAGLSMATGCAEETGEDRDRD